MTHTGRHTPTCDGTERGLKVFKVNKDKLEEMIQAFGEGWQDEDKEKDGSSLPGDRRRAGLTKALKLIDIEVDDSWRKR